MAQEPFCLGNTGHKRAQAQISKVIKVQNDDARVILNKNHLAFTKQKFSWGGGGNKRDYSYYLIIFNYSEAFDSETSVVYFNWFNSYFNNNVNLDI